MTFLVVVMVSLAVAVATVAWLESLRLLDAAERGKLQRRVDELEHGVVVLIAQIRRAGMTPEWSPAPASADKAHPAGSQAAETDMLVDLWQRIQEHFSQDEMDDLAFELQLRNCAGDSPGAKARELVMCAKRHHRLEQLQELCRRERPEGGF